MTRTRAANGGSGDKQELADGFLRLDVAVCGGGVFERVGAVDQDVEGAVLNPRQHLFRALAPLRGCQFRAIGSDTYQAYAVWLVQQADRRNPSTGEAVGDEGA